MSFVIDHCADLAVCIFLIYFGFEVWYNFFSSINKLTDEEVIQNYTFLKTKGVIK